MTRHSIRQVAFFVLILAALLPRDGSAGRPRHEVVTAPLDAGVVATDPVSTSGVHTAWTFDPAFPTVLAPDTCAAVTPVIHRIERLVPETGSRTSCTTDAQCGAGESCVDYYGGATGRCRASGHLQRGAIDYVAGGLYDLELTIPPCTKVTDMLMNGASLSGTGDGIDWTSPASWSVVSNTSIQFNGQPAWRTRVRVPLGQFVDGASSTIQVRVAAITGDASIVSAPVTVARVAAVNAAMRTTVAETHLRNGFVASMYRMFGDFDEHRDANGKRLAYDLVWDEFRAIAVNNQIVYRGTDVRIGNGLVMFSTQFTGDGPACDGSVFVDGAFRLVPGANGNGMAVQWVLGPRANVNLAAYCSILSFGLLEIAADIIAAARGITDEIERTVSAQLNAQVGADEEGHIETCLGCRVVDVRIGDGRIDVWIVPPTDRVRLEVSTTRATDRTSDPTQGLALPAGMWAPVVAGGTYESCVAANGTPASVCERRVLDANGLFNWWGSDVPVPSPWEMGANGLYAYYAPRHNAWQRLQGVTRQVATLPDAAFPAGALLARRTGSASRSRIETGCVVPPDLSNAYRMSLGVNDVPVVGTEPPTRGQLEATVLLANDASQSDAMFGSLRRCRTGTAARIDTGLGSIRGGGTIGVAY